MDHHFLHYNDKGYPMVNGFVNDIAVFTMQTEQLQLHTPPRYTLSIMLIKRAVLTKEGTPNAQGGKWALPGGFITPFESDLEGAVRELAEETSVHASQIHRIQNYSKIGRDERGWFISSAFYAVMTEESLAQRLASDDAEEVALFPVSVALEMDLAFDHSQIMRDALGLVVRDILRTNIAKYLLPEQFTLSELRGILVETLHYFWAVKDCDEEFSEQDHATILNDKLFPKRAKNFPFLERIEGAKTQRTAPKPTNLYRFTSYKRAMSIYR